MYWDGTFYCDDGLRLGRDVQHNDPDTFTLWGGDNSLFAPTPENYQPLGEQAQNANLRTVVAFMVANPDIVIQWQKDHGYTVPTQASPYEDFWVPQDDWLICAQNMKTGSGIDDVFNALLHAGYSNDEIKDLVCKHLDDEFISIDMPSGVGSNGILAIILGTPIAWRIRDPVFYIDPATGLLCNNWYADHIGGE